jgi:hypothetical protein
VNEASEPPRGDRWSGRRARVACSAAFLDAVRRERTMNYGECLKRAILQQTCRPTAGGTYFPLRTFMYARNSVLI